MDASTQNRAALGKRVCGQPGGNCPLRTCPGSGLLWKGCVCSEGGKAPRGFSHPQKCERSCAGTRCGGQGCVLSCKPAWFHFRHSHRLHGPYVTPLASVSCEVGLLIIAATFQGGCRDEIQDRIESL